MNNVRQIKQRIKTAQNIAKITKAMEMVSASKMKRAQDIALAARPYAQTLYESLQLLQQNVVTYVHPLLEKHEHGKDVLILVSTDRGLCGSLNPNLFKSTMQWYNKHKEPELVVVGKKAVNFARVYGLQVQAEFTDLGDTIELEDILPITALVTKGFTDQTYKSVSIVFMDFVNTLTQKVTVTQILPLEDIHQLNEGALVSTQAQAEYTFEPSPAEILNELLPYYLETSIFHAFLEAKASEHSARMVAMKNASENAKDLVYELNLAYNKSRQEGITTELLDITTAILTQG